MADQDRSSTEAPNSGPGDYKDALHRLKSRLGEMREATADPYDALGPASHPAADIARLAKHLGHATGSDVPTEVPDALPGPATINVLAERAGFVVHWEAMSPGSLEAGDIPAVVLLRNRTSRLIVGRPNAGEFHVLGANGICAVPVGLLDKYASGTVFRLTEIRAEVPAPAAEPAPPKEVTVEPVMKTPEPSLDAAPAAVKGVKLGALLASALRGQHARIVHLCIASALINLFGLALPLFSMAVFDRVIPHAAFETLWALALGATLALCLEMLLRQARLRLFDAVGLTSSLAMQGRLVSRLVFARAGALPKNAGHVIPAMHELDQAALLAPQLVVALAVDLPFFLLIMLFIAAIGGPVVFAPLIGMALLVILHIVSHVIARRSHAQQVGESRRQMQHVMDAISGAERIRVTSAGETVLAGWEKAADTASFAGHLVRYWQGIAAQGGAVLVQAVIVATVVIGAYRVQDTAMTIGALSAAILLVNRAMMPVSILTSLVFRAIQLGESLAVVAPLMQASVERASDRQATPANPVAGKFDLHRVTFAYPAETRPSLREVSLSIRPGERVGLIGKAGCGKSTLLRLLARLAEPSEGRILVDERDIRHFDPGQLRQAIALMPQDTALIDASLHENLTIGLGNVEKAHFERITRIAGVHDFASVHPAGYGLAVGPGGQRLSGGERQAVALARALMGRPSMLLLDEPTAAMDNGAESRLILELKKPEFAAMGLIIATHRLPVLALVDRVIWLDQGRVVADGPKDQVFARLGIAA